MAVRTVEYTIDSGGRVTPSAPLYGGVQGEHNATAVTFNISAIAKSGAYYRVEWIDGAGEFGSSEHLEAQSGVITYPLSGEVTSGGVKITLTLIQAVMNENNVEQVLFAVPVLIFLTAAGVDENTVANYKRGLSGLALTAAQQASEAENSAQQAAESAAKAVEAEENIENAISVHNTDTETHEDIRDEVKKLGNSIPNSIYAHNVDDTSHSDIRKNLVNHNTDTTAHPDIRDDINTLGSIHVPQAIKSHNTDTTAHADIRDDINNLGNTVIPNTVKSAVNAHNTDTSNTHLDIRDAIQNMGDTVVPNIVKTAVEEHDMDTTAHADIREQRNDDMNNLSANIIPGIASAKVQAHNTDETAHSDIREKIAALESDSVPDYWQDVLDNKVMLIRETLGVAGQNKSAFLWYTDAHWNKNYGKSPILLKYLYNNTPLNKTNFGGDIVQDEPDDDTIDDCIEMSYLHEWRKLVKDINHHSVVGNHDDGSVVNNRFSQEYIYSYLLAYEECPEMHIGDGLYYYIDDSCEKTRYLYLDTAYQTSNDNQSQFIVDTLLSTPKDWHVVVIAHIWHDAMWTEEQGDYIGDYSAIASKFLSLLYDYNHRASGNIKVSSTSIEYDFTDCGGKVEFCIGGHAHWDHISYYNDEIPVILTETDSYRCRVNYTATQGTTTENAVNAIIADYTNKTIHVIRVGRGEDIEVSIKSTTAVTYTNVLASAISLDDMTSVLTGDDGSVGFLNNKRWSNSAASYIDLNGWDTSGAIPCKAGDVIRLKNITMYPYSDSSSYGDQGYINFYSSEGSYVNSTSLYNSDGVLPSDFAAEYDESGNIIQFTIPSWTSLINDMAYFSIACQDINENSVITINEELE